MNSPLLTIAIPTYNHHELLLTQLTNLLPQLTNEISLLIIDNNSVPSVSDYLALNNFKCDNLTIIRNQVNIGADANICRCFEICETEWLWVLSDNDYLKSDAVSFFLDSINNNRDCVFINHNYEFNKTDIYTIGFDEFCKNCDYGRSFFITICGYNISKLKPYLIYYYKYLSSNHGQLLLVLKFLELNKTGKCLLTAQILTIENLPAEWSKFEFIENSRIVFTAFRAAALVTFNKYIGQQMHTSNLYNLIHARIVENISLKSQLRSLIFILDKSSFSQILQKKYFRPLLINIFIIFFPNMYKRLKG